MAGTKAFVIDTIPTDPIFCKTYLGSKVKYIRHAVVINIEKIEEISDEVFKILVNSQWKNVIETKIVIGGEWKNVISSNIIVDGEWKN